MSALQHLKFVAAGIAAFGCISVANATVIDGVNIPAGDILGITDLLQNAPTKIGDTLTAVGIIGTLDQFASPLCAKPNCELTFVASGFKVVNNSTPNALGFSGGEIKVFEIDGGGFTITNSSPATLAAAIAGADPGGSKTHLFLDLVGHTHTVANPAGNFTLSATGNVNGSTTKLAFADGQLDVVGGDAGAFFDTNSIDDGLGGFADFQLTGSASTLHHRGDIVFASGSDTITGLTNIPEPATTGILGVGLLVMWGGRNWHRRSRR